jgi:DNA-binding NarL/FixJ family response regulator
MERISLLLVDDEPQIRRGLRMRLELEPDFEVVGEAENGSAAVDLASALAPNVVLMDVEMPVMNGIDAATQITANSGRTAVVIISMHDDAATISRAKAAGAAAFVAKSQIDSALIDAIRGAARNDRRCA